VPVPVMVTKFPVRVAGPESKAYLMAALDFEEAETAKGASP
jgi:hypothetical protein